MIVLLSICSTSWSQNDNTRHNGDSALIAIDAIRVANAKMIELKYEKEINANLLEVIRTDSIIINNLQNDVECCKYDAELEIKKIKKQRNKAIVAGVVTTGCLVGLMILFYGK